MEVLLLFLSLAILACYSRMSVCDLSLNYDVHIEFVRDGFLVRR